MEATIDQILRLERSGLRFSANRGKVNVAGNLDKLTDQDREWIRNNRDDLIGILDVTLPLTSSPDPSTEDVPYSLTPGQANMWTGARHPNPMGYSIICQANVSFSTRIIGPLDKDRLRTALDLLGVCHPILRARIDQKEPRQTFADMRLLIEFEDAREANLTDDEIRQRLKEFEQRPFEFFGGALTRVGLTRIANSDHVLQVACNHSISDAWSTNTLRQDLERFYFDASETSAARAFEAAQSFLAYLRWEGSTQAKARKQLASGRWRDWLSETQPGGSALVYDRPRSYGADAKQGTDAVVQTQLEDSLGTLVREAAKALRVTPGTLVVAGLLLLAGRESQSNHPLILMLDSGRWRPDQTSFCGMFVNNLPVSMQLDPVEQLGQYVRCVHELIAIRKAEPCSWQQLLDALPQRQQLDPDRPGHIAINVWPFNTPIRTKGDQDPLSTEEHGSLHWTPAPNARNAVRFLPISREYPGTSLPCDICPNVLLAEQIHCSWDYNSDLFDAATILATSNSLGDILKTICLRPGTSLSSVL